MEDTKKYNVLALKMEGGDHKQEMWEAYRC